LVLVEKKEVEEREKVVRQMWDLYSHSRTNSVGLPKFWWEAFEAAYEELVSDVGGVRDGAVSEIAKMSLLRSLPLQLHQVSTNLNLGSFFFFSMYVPFLTSFLCMPNASRFYESPICVWMS